MRQFAGALVVTLVIGLFLTGCDGVASRSETAEAPGQESVAIQKNGPSTAASLAQQLNAVRQSTKKYRDIETARADGYAPVSPYVPGMGFHFADQVPPFGTDRNDPPVLVYFPNGSYTPAPGDPHDAMHDDDLILGAVEYIVLGNQTDNPPNLFNDEQSPRMLKVSEEHGWHYESSEGFTGLHAWIHRGNPGGVFHHTNPNIE